MINNLYTVQKTGREIFGLLNADVVDAVLVCNDCPTAVQRMS